MNSSSGLLRFRRKVTMAAIGSFLFCGPLVAQPSRVVSAQDLVSWTFLGESKAVFTPQHELVLAPSSQLARSFPAPEVALTVTTKPIIGTSYTDWPVLEFGSTALVFSRTGNVGKLVLVVGDDAPIELPFTYDLEADGHSITALAVGSKLKDATISVEASGQTLHYPAEQAAGAPLEIILSAGQSESWLIDHLEVMTGSTDAPANPTGASGQLFGSAEDGLNSSVFKPSETDSTIDTSDGSRNELELEQGKKEAALTSASNELEIFTPPSIRQNTVNAMRAAAWSTLKK